jgi:hypothetical protein
MAVERTKSLIFSYLAGRFLWLERARCPGLVAAGRIRPAVGFLSYQPIALPSWWETSDFNGLGP